MKLKRYLRKCTNYYIAKYVGSPRLWVHDLLENHRYLSFEKKILIVRHGAEAPHFYDIILDWTAEHFPAIRRRFELHQLPCRVFDWSKYRLHVPWLQDPVQHWSPLAYEQAQRLAVQCDRHGIAIINRVDKLINATKSNGSRILGELGIRTPKMALIENVDEFKQTLYGLHLPLIVREDWGHGLPMQLVENQEDLRKLRLDNFARPVAVEFIDTRSPADGLYRKYRYLATGDRGVAQTMHVQKSWLVRGSECEFSEALVNEERAFIDNPDPNWGQLQKARVALELDIVAFDYGYDRDGDLVVWEANPYPYLHFPTAGGNRLYRKPTVERAIAAVLALYLERAGLPIPSQLEDRLAGYSPLPVIAGL